MNAKDWIFRPGTMLGLSGIAFLGMTGAVVAGGGGTTTQVVTAPPSTEPEATTTTAEETTTVVTVPSAAIWRIAPHLSLYTTLPFVVAD